MTCIIGYLDRKKEIGYLIGDTLGSDSATHEVYTNFKVFRDKRFSQVIIGCAMSYRHIDLVKYSSDLFSDAKSVDDITHGFMVNSVIPKLRNLFLDGVYFEKPEENGAAMIIVTPKSIFGIQPDYSVLEPDDGCAYAIGSGKIVALGSMYTMQHLMTAGMLSIPVQEMMTIALKTSKDLSRGVGGPFTFITTDPIYRENPTTYSDVVDKGDHSNPGLDNGSSPYF